MTSLYSHNGGCDDNNTITPTPPLPLRDILQRIRGRQILLRGHWLPCPPAPAWHHKHARSALRKSEPPSTPTPSYVNNNNNINNNNNNEATSTPTSSYVTTGVTRGRNARKRKATKQRKAFADLARNAHSDYKTVEYQQERYRKLQRRKRDFEVKRQRLRTCERTADFNRRGGRWERVLRFCSEHTWHIFYEFLEGWCMRHHGRQCAHYPRYRRVMQCTGFPSAKDRYTTTFWKRFRPPSFERPV